MDRTFGPTTCELLEVARASIGISGWRYPPWRGVFYPQGLRQASELHFASRSFSTIEINGSFYSLMRPETYEAWYQETPKGFTFAVKGGRYITHLKRLKDVALPLANFFASGVLRLREKLGPILWQLPPQQVFDERKLRAFFELLPGSTQQAARLARRHDQRLAGRSETRALTERPLRHALEVRHDSFKDKRFYDLARKYNAAIVFAHDKDFPEIDEPTADFTYARLMGSEEKVKTGYKPAELDKWAKRANAWAKKGDAFVYFISGAKVRNPAAAQALMEKV